MLFRIRMLIAAALTAFVVGAATPSAEAGARKHMIRAINSARSWSNRRQVQFSRRLSGGAAAWARNLMRRQVLGHASLHGGEGEIIEWHTGAGARIGSTVREWLNSPEHRTVMLGDGFRRAGAGRAVGYFGGQRCTIWVVRFAG